MLVFLQQDRGNHRQNLDIETPYRRKPSPRSSGGVSASSAQNRKKSAKITPLLSSRNSSVEAYMIESFEEDATPKKSSRNQILKPDQRCTTTIADIHQSRKSSESHSARPLSTLRNGLGSFDESGSGRGYNKSPSSYSSEYDPTLRDMRPSLTVAQAPSSSKSTRTLVTPSRVRSSKSIPGLSSYAATPIKLSKHPDSQMTSSHPSLHSSDPCTSQQQGMSGTSQPILNQTSQGIPTSSSKSDRHEVDLSELKQRLVSLDHQLRCGSVDVAVPRSRHSVTGLRASSLMPANHRLQDAQNSRNSSHTDNHRMSRKLPTSSCNIIPLSATSSMNESSLFQPSNRKVSRENNHNSLVHSDNNNSNREIIGFKTGRSRKISPSGNIDRTSNGIINVTTNSGNRSRVLPDSQSPLTRSASVDADDTERAKSATTNILSVSHA